MVTDYAYALIKKYPGKQYCLRGDDYDGLEWLDDSPKPTREELDAAYLEVRKEDEAARPAKEALEAKRARKPSVQEQLEIMEELGFDEWRKQMQMISQEVVNGK